jgi:hypothetical protein
MSGRVAGTVVVVSCLTTLVLAVGLMILAFNRPPVNVTAVVSVPTFAVIATVVGEAPTPIVEFETAVAVAPTPTVVEVPDGVPVPAPPAFVGEVSETDAFIGVMRDGEDILVYVCDGKQGKGTISEWFRGRVPEDGGSVTLTSQGGAELALELGADIATGRVTLKDGKVHEFNAQLVTGDGGLARIEDQKDGKPRVRGWIFMPDGRFRGDGFPTDCACNGATGTVFCPVILEGQPVRYFSWCTDCCEE